MNNFVCGHNQCTKIATNMSPDGCSKRCSEHRNDIVVEMAKTVNGWINSVVDRLDNSDNADDTKIVLTVPRADGERWYERGGGN